MDKTLGIDLESMQTNCERVSSVLKVLAHPQRLMILCLLAKEVKTVTELQRICQISQSGVSQFLARMKQEGLVSCTREGSHIFYSIKDADILKLIFSLHEIYCPNH